MHKNLVSGLLVDSLINGLANWSNFRRKKKMIVTFAFMLASFMNDDYVVAS
mgnify:FL=1